MICENNNCVRGASRSDSLGGEVTYSVMGVVPHMTSDGSKSEIPLVTVSTTGSFQRSRYDSAVLKMLRLCSTASSLSPDDIKDSAVRTEVSCAFLRIISSHPSSPL